MKTSYLIYRPAVDYEESMSPYLIINSKIKAIKIIKNIEKWAKSVINDFPPQVFSNDFVNDEGIWDEEKYSDMWNKRDYKVNKILEKVIIPYIDKVKGYEIISDLRQGEIHIEMMELPKL